MPKLQFSGLYKSAKEIPPLQLMDYYIKGDQQERREAGNELLRRLDAYEAATRKEAILEDRLEPTPRHYTSSYTSSLCSFCGSTHCFKLSCKD